MRLRPLIYLSFILVVAPTYAQVADIPDPNLRQAAREALELPDSTAITQQEMLRLITLPAENREITDLDDEIYLTTKSFADVNSDGVVNVLDLVFVAQQFSE